MPVRLFLFFAALLASGLLAAAPTAAPGNTEFHDKVIHLSVTRPEAWHFQTPKEKRDSRGAVTYENKRWGMMIRQETFPARMIISKYAEPYAGLNPSVSIDRYPLGDYRFKDSLWIVDRVLGNYRRILFTPFEVVAGPFQTTLAGKPAAYCRTRYELALVGLPPMKIEQQLWAVANGLEAVIIVATGSQIAPDQSEAEINAIVQSLRFDK